MSAINSLPPELLSSIISLLPAKQRSSLVCKLWHSLYVVTDLRNLKNQDRISWNAYFSNACNNPLTWDVINTTDIKQKYPMDLRVDKLKEQLPYLKVLANIKLHVKDITIMHEPLQTEMDDLFLLHPQIETVYFPQCYQPSALNYPASLKKLFFYKVDSALRPKMTELENTQKMEVVVLEPLDMKERCALWLNEYDKTDDDEKAEYFKKFWNNPFPAETKCISPAEKFKCLLHFPEFLCNPLRKKTVQFLQGQVFKDLKKQVEENPKHTLALNSLGALLFFLAPKGNLAEAETWVKKALEIDPENVLSNTLLMCFYDQKCKIGEASQPQLRELITTTHCQLMDSASKNVVRIWLKIGATNSFLAKTDEGKYWGKPDVHYQNVWVRTAQKEGYVTFNFEHLMDLAMDCMRQNPQAGEHFEAWRQICLERYPEYAPFLQTMKGEHKDGLPYVHAMQLKFEDSTEWEKAYHPEKLQILKLMRDRCRELKYNPYNQQ